MTSASRCVPVMTATSSPCRSDVNLVNDLCRGARAVAASQHRGAPAATADNICKELGSTRAGGLLSHALSFSDLYRRAAEFGDKIRTASEAFFLPPASSGET